MNSIPLGELMAPSSGSVDPSRFENEEFELYSIPAHDRGGPEIVHGFQIGSTKQVVRPGDVMISRIIPHIRRARIVEADRGLRQIASGEWIVFRSEQVDPGYLKHFLLSDGFNVQFMNTAAGVGGSLVRARPQFVKQIEMPLPSLGDQRRIAATLDRAERRRAARHRILHELDELVQSIYLERFGDVQVVVEFGEVANLVGGRNLVADDPDADSDYRVLKISAVTSGLFKPSESKPLPIGYVPPSAHIVREGDLLMSRANTEELVGAVALVHDAPKNLALPDKVWRFEFRDGDSDARFYHAVFQSSAVKRSLRRLASGTGGSMKNISKTKLQKLLIPNVDVSRQLEFSQIVQTVAKVRSQNERAAELEGAMCASLRARAFRGEL